MTREEKCEQARANPRDLAAQLDAAYACDRDGLEAEAIRFYDAAHALGANDGEFLIGYGSTLKNVGRLDDSLAILARAERDPKVSRAARAFRALTLHRAGNSDAAIAVLVRLVAELDVPRYRPALESYAEELEH